MSGELKPKYKEFIKEFLICADIDTAAEKVGLNPNAIVKALTNNASLFSDKLRQAIHRKKVAASYYEPDVVLNSLYVMATDKDAKSDSRVRAAKIWLENRSGNGDIETNEDKFNEILQIVGKKDE